MGRISPSHADALDWLPPKLQEGAPQEQSFRKAFDLHNGHWNGRVVIGLLKCEDDFLCLLWNRP
jgi:hypothetical protein